MLRGHAQSGLLTSIPAELAEDSDVVTYCFSGRMRVPDNAVDPEFKGLVS